MRVLKRGAKSKMADGRVAWRSWDVFGWTVWYWYGSAHVEIRYVPKGDVDAVLVVFIPWTGGPLDRHHAWRVAMQTDWLKKAKAAKAAVSAKNAEVEDEAFASKHPALFAFMTSLTEDGQARELCKVQLFADAGHWKAALHDGNTEASLFVTLGRPQDVFQALEKALTAESPDWRSWTKRTGKKSK